MILYNFYWRGTDSSLRTVVSISKWISIIASLIIIQSTIRLKYKYEIGWDKCDFGTRPLKES